VADLTAFAGVGDSAPRELLQAVNVDRAPAAATTEGTTGNDGFLKFFPLRPGSSSAWIRAIFWFPH
jgi:hypothetical protein